MEKPATSGIIFGEPLEYKALVRQRAPGFEDITGVALYQKISQMLIERSIIWLFQFFGGEIASI